MSNIIPFPSRSQIRKQVTAIADELDQVMAGIWRLSQQFSRPGFDYEPGGYVCLTRKDAQGTADVIPFGHGRRDHLRERE